jgi:hypothetical protein
MRMARMHRDYDGRVPQHTWFYPGEQPDPPIMQILHELTSSGFGEVQLHFHHGMDTYESLRPRLIQAIHEFEEYGFLKTVDERTAFGFIHGNFDLDNSTGPEQCGVNNELHLLHELGCFGDFSFPSVYLDSQPPSVNTIYAAQDDGRPKSYARALPLRALDDGRADLLIFEGPLIFAPTLNARRLFLDLDDGDIHPAKPASTWRAARWVRADVHVPERPDWIFIKLFTHGISSAAEEDEVVGEHFSDTLSYLERAYNDGREYRLHYITAREAYNLAMSAARGARGDAANYINAIVPPYMSDRITDVVPAAGT